MFNHVGSWYPNLHVDGESTIDAVQNISCHDMLGWGESNFLSSRIIKKDLLQKPHVERA